MSHLSQRLLNNLKKYYDKITMLFEEGLALSEIREEIDLPPREITKLINVVFHPRPIYSANNIFGETVYYESNLENWVSTEKTKNDYERYLEEIYNG